MRCGGVVYGADPDVDHGNIIVIAYSCLYISLISSILAAVNSTPVLFEHAMGISYACICKCHIHLHPASTSCINILYLCIAINRQPNAGKLRGERRDVREKTFDGCIPDYQSCSWFRAVHGVSLYDAGMNCMSPQKVALRHDLYLHCLYPRTIPVTPLKEAQYHQ